MKLNNTRLSALFLLISSLTFMGCESAAEFLGVSILMVGIFGLLALVLIIWAVFDLISSSRPLVEKVLWGLAIWFIPFFGAIAYLLIGKK